MIRTRGEYLGFTSKTTPPNLYLEQLRIQKKFSLLPRITSKEMQTTFYDFPEFIASAQRVSNEIWKCLGCQQIHGWEVKNYQTSI